MKKSLLLKAAMNSLAVLSLNFSFGQDTLAKWAYENLPATYTSNGGYNGSVPDIAPYAPESGIKINIDTSYCTGYHAATAALWSGPTGYNSTKALNTNNWAADDYFQFTTSTYKYKNVMLYFGCFGSNTGPKNFKVQYSIDGSSYVDLSNGDYTVANSWSLKSFSLPTNLDNLSHIYIRLTCTGTTPIGTNSNFGSGGTSRVDSIYFIGTPIESTTPVSIISFSSQKENTAIQLLWKTGVEANADYFKIESSSDSKIWDSIGSAKATGSNSAYSFYDYAPKIGMNYYRLSAIDLDGTVKTGAVINQLFGKSGNEIKIVPNPVTNGMLNITLSSTAATSVPVSITDLSGKIVLSAVIPSGTTSYTLNVSHLHAGIFLLSLTNGIYSTSSKILIK